MKIGKSTQHSIKIETEFRVCTLFTVVKRMIEIQKRIAGRFFVLEVLRNRRKHFQNSKLLRTVFVN